MLVKYIDNKKYTLVSKRISVSDAKDLADVLRGQGGLVRVIRRGHLAEVYVHYSN